jgi:hypothetical protein
MKLNPEKHHDGNQQTAICPEAVSNEGHVYAALGVFQQEIDTWTQRELQLVQQDGNYDRVAARNATDQQKWLSG